MLYTLSFIARALFAAIIILISADMPPEQRLNLLVAGSIQLIPMIVEMNSSQVLIKWVGRNDNKNPVFQIIKFFIPIMIITFLLTCIYSIKIFSNPTINLILTCGSAVFISQCSKIPDIIMKAKKDFEKTYLLDIIITIFQTSVILTISGFYTLSAITFVYSLIMASISSLVLKSFYAMRYHYDEKADTQPNNNFFFTTLKASGAVSLFSFSTTVLTSLSVPVFAQRLPTDEAIFLVLAFRVFSYCDQFSWASFYSSLPLIFTEIKVNREETIQNYKKKMRSVVTIFCALFTAALFVLMTELAQNIMGYRIFLNISFVLFFIFLSNRVLAMIVQVLLADDRMFVPWLHLILVATLALSSQFLSNYIEIIAIIYTCSVLGLIIKGSRKIVQAY
jgi:hypothetical protein